MQNGPDDIVPSVSDLRPVSQCLDSLVEHSSQAGGDAGARLNCELILSIAPYSQKGVNSELSPGPSQLMSNSS